MTNTQCEGVTEVVYQNPIVLLTKLPISLPNLDLKESFLNSLGLMDTTSGVHSSDVRIKKVKRLSKSGNSVLTHGKFSSKHRRLQRSSVKAYPKDLEESEYLYGSEENGTFNKLATVDMTSNLGQKLYASFSFHPLRLQCLIAEYEKYCNHEDTTSIIRASARLGTRHLESQTSSYQPRHNHKHLSRFYIFRHRNYRDQMILNKYGINRGSYKLMKKLKPCHVCVSRIKEIGDDQSKTMRDTVPTSSMSENAFTCKTSREETISQTICPQFSNDNTIEDRSETAMTEVSINVEPTIAELSLNHYLFISDTKEKKSKDPRITSLWEELVPEMPKLHLELTNCQDKVDNSLIPLPSPTVLLNAWLGS